HDPDPRGSLHVELLSLNLTARLVAAAAPRLARPSSHLTARLVAAATPRLARPSSHLTARLVAAAAPRLARPSVRYPCGSACRRSGSRRRRRTPPGAPRAGRR